MSFETYRCPKCGRTVNHEYLSYYMPNVMCHHPEAVYMMTLLAPKMPKALLNVKIIDAYDNEEIYADIDNIVISNHHECAWYAVLTRKDGEAIVIEQEPISLSVEAAP